MLMLRAYDDVSTCRSSAGMGIGAVPITAVYAWAEHHSMSFELTNHLWRVVRLVDARVRANASKGAR